MSGRMSSAILPLHPRRFAPRTTLVEQVGLVGQVGLVEQVGWWSGWR
jgi:hypothetical protein